MTFFTILIIGLGTLLIRICPLLLRPNFSPALTRWMQQIPIAVVSALLFTEIFWRGDHMDLSFRNLFLWVTLPTAFVGMKSRNLLLTVATGMACILIARVFMGR
jgi:branched-subunit amino acid transport protein